jgi:hypothetical protein
MYYFAIITSVTMPHEDSGETNRPCLRAGCHGRALDGYPWECRLSMLKPKPSRLQHPAPKLEVSDAKATQGKWALDMALDDNAFSTMDNIGSHPHKALHDSVHGLVDPRWQLDTERRVDRHC